MRMSQLLFQSLREVPAEAETMSHQLLLRAAYIRQHAAGIFSYLPLGLRVKQKLETLIRQEMEAIDAQEVSLPVVQSSEVWQRSQRWYEIDADLARFKDRNGRDFCLGMTHEEVMTEVVGQVVQSYRQLPLRLFQIQTKFRDEPRPRAGLIRTREFTMKDAYSFDLDETAFEKTYQLFYDAYFRIFERCGLEVIAVESDTGMMGGDRAHEFMVPTQIGEDTLLLCSSCAYKANRQIARFKKLEMPSETMLPLEEIATPNVKTIEALASFLNVPASKTAKAVFLMASLGQEERFVFAVIRGERDLNETKLAQVLGAKQLRPATEAEVRAVGAEPGYASPIGLALTTMTLVVDELVTQSANLVAGANKVGFHLLNTNYARDFEADIVADISAAEAGDICPECGAALRAERGVEVGNIFKLGTHFSEALGARFLDDSGSSQPLFMGSYGVGIGRLMSCLVERYHDEAGMCWPRNIAPYQVAVLALAGKRSPEVLEQAELLYQQCLGAGFEVLYDDRDESPGVKFKDADLIGIPVRVTIGKKGLGRSIAEVKARDAQDHTDVLLKDLLGYLQSHLKE